MTNGTVIFAEGERQQSIYFQAFDDGLVEPNETIEVTLSNSSGGARIGEPGVASLYIYQNDYPGALLTNLLEFRFCLNGGTYQKPRELEWGNLKLVVWPDGSAVIAGSVPLLEDRQLVRLLPDGTLDAAFVPAAVIQTGRVHVVVPQTGGRILLGGSLIASAGTIPNFGLVRLSAAGALDQSFVSPLQTNAGVAAIAALPDGRLLIGGLFRATSNGEVRHLARLGADGSIDPSYHPAFTGGGLIPPSEHWITNTAVYALGREADGRILVGGNFEAVNGVQRLALARLFPDGSLDTSFSAVVEGPVKQIAVLSDGRFYIRGLFDYVNGRLRRQVARLNPDGSSDVSFRPPAEFGNGDLTAMEVQADGKLLLGGTLWVGMLGNLMPGLFRLNPNGSRDVTFQPDIAGVGAFAIRDSTLLLFHARACGWQSWLSIVSLEATNGPPLVEFEAYDTLVEENTTNATVTLVRTGDLRPFSVDFQTADGTATVGKDYLAVRGTVTFERGQTQKTVAVPILEDVLGEDHETIELLLSSPPAGTVLGNNAKARLWIMNDDSGSIDASFRPFIYRGVRQLLAQTDGRIIAVGDFRVDGERRPLVRFNVNGTVDRTFAFDVPLTEWWYPAFLVAQFDGQIVGATVVNVFSLDGDGHLQGVAKLDGSIRALALQPDGKILLATMPRPYTHPREIVQLHPDGTRDESFNSEASVLPFFPRYGPAGITAFAAQPDGKIIIAGAFGKVSGRSLSFLARLHPDGSLDDTFLPVSRLYGPVVHDIFVSPTVAVYAVPELRYISALALQPDGAMVIGGPELLLSPYPLLRWRGREGETTVRLVRRHDSPA